MMSKARLELGRILATPGALRVLGSTTAVAEAPPLRGLGRGDYQTLGDSQETNRRVPHRSRD